MSLRRRDVHALWLPAQLALIFILMVAWFVVPHGADTSVMWTTLALFYTYLALSALQPFQAVKGIPTVVKIETLFLLFYYLLFFYPYQAHLLGLSDFRDNKFISDAYPEGANQALVAASIGFVSFHLGFSLVGKHPVRQSSRVQVEVEVAVQRHLAAFFFAILMIMITFYVFAGLKSDDEARYINEGASVTPLSNGIYMLIYMLCILCVSQVIVHYRKARRIDFLDIISGLVVTVWSFRILLNGDRNSFFLVLIAAGGGFATFIRRTHLIFLCAGFVVSLALYNFVELYRLTPDGSLSSMVATFERSGESEDVSTGSFGISTLSLRAVFGITPAQEGFGLGKYKLVGFAGIIPFSRGFLLGSNPGYTDTAQVLTAYILGADASWGAGTNVLTDVYIDFGIFGVPVLLTFAGIFAGKAQRDVLVKPGSTKAITIYLLVLSTFGELPRYAFDEPARMIAWTYLLFWIFEKATFRARVASALPILHSRSNVVRRV